MVTHIPAVDSEQPTYDMTDKALVMCGGWKIRRNVYYPPEVLGVGSILLWFRSQPLGDSARLMPQVAATIGQIDCTTSHSRLSRLALWARTD